MQSGKSDEGGTSNESLIYATMGLDPSANLVTVGNNTNSDLMNVISEPLTDRNVNSPKSLSGIQNVKIQRIKKSFD